MLLNFWLLQQRYDKLQPCNCINLAISINKQNQSAKQKLAQHLVVQESGLDILDSHLQQNLALEVLFPTDFDHPVLLQLLQSVLHECPRVTYLQTIANPFQLGLQLRHRNVKAIGLADDVMQPNQDNNLMIGECSHEFVFGNMHLIENLIDNRNVDYVDLLLALASLNAAFHCFFEKLATYSEVPLLQGLQLLRCKFQQSLREVQIDFEFLFDLFQLVQNNGHNLVGSIGRKHYILYLCNFERVLPTIFLQTIDGVGYPNKYEIYSLFEEKRQKVFRNNIGGTFEQNFNFLYVNNTAFVVLHLLQLPQYLRCSPSLRIPQQIITYQLLHMRH